MSELKKLAARELRASMKVYFRRFGRASEPGKPRSNSLIIGILADKLRSALVLPVMAFKWRDKYYQYDFFIFL